MRFLQYNLIFLLILICPFALSAEKKGQPSIFNLAEYYDKSGRPYEAVTEYKRFLYSSDISYSAWNAAAGERILYHILKSKHQKALPNQANEIKNSKIITEKHRFYLNYNYSLMQLDQEPVLFSPLPVIKIRNNFHQIILEKEDERLRMATTLRLIKSAERKFSKKMASVPYADKKLEQMRRRISREHDQFFASENYRYLAGIIPGGYQFFFANQWTGLKSFITVGLFAASGIAAFQNNLYVTGALATALSARFYIDSWLLSIKIHENYQIEKRNRMIQKIAADYSFSENFYVNRSRGFYFSAPQKRF